MNCPYCGLELKRSISTRDHIFARSRGGGNGKYNIVVVHERCNLYKRNLHLEEFLQSVKEYLIVAPVDPSSKKRLLFARLSKHIPLFMTSDKYKIAKMRYEGALKFFYNSNRL